MLALASVDNFALNAQLRERAEINTKSKAFKIILARFFASKSSWCEHNICK